MLSAQKCARAKLTTEQKAECRQKYTKLTDAINTARDSYQEEARSIAQDHGRSLKWTRAELNGSRLTRQRRKASAWNAFVRGKLNEANETCGPGQHYRLPAFISAHHTELQRTYRRLSEPEKKKLRLGIDDLCTMRVNIVRSNPKALLKDVNSTFNTMEKEWTAINARTSMEGFYIAVRGDLEHYHEAKLFLTAKAKSFIKDVLHFEPKLLALKFESHRVVDVHDTAASIVETHNILQKNKLASKKIPMNYNNYEKRIVEVYAIAIDGWTYEKSVCNPGKIGRREHLIKLLDALVTGTCSWVTLNDDEVSERISNNCKHQASGEQVYKPRKAARRHKADSAKSAQIISDSNLEDGEEDNHNEQDGSNTNSLEGSVDME
ncbi:uncharacterized protein EDB91DRAFT_1269742 [Suillus paluster]|uniref:uncharacterized protein n=1 Tax=Suillus paluster TaxID=48578 RepID=UPI001B85E3F4|nr:uncharacterized protein EDB91DRAFT_1269742 [Suillus paluster]KAG1745400.1 hypothetical protein EDB91DRAFT_1269742 [Suillus paluster]